MTHSNHFLPITKKEAELLGWEELDVILISGDAYIDHPSFGTAVIGRTLEKAGLKVAIIPQPNWKDDLRDFKKFGKPKLFFGITAGNMDSMVNHYTAYKRLRSNDAYTPGGNAGFRPDYATIVYSNIVRSLFPDTPIIIGGIEASMRRLSHYDYWSDSLKPSILIDSKADALIYGMGEKPILELVKIFQNQNSLIDYNKIQQIAFTTHSIETYKTDKEVIFLNSFEKELADKRLWGDDFVTFDRESNKMHQKTLIQPYKDCYLVIKPPYPTATEEEMDEYALFDYMQNAPHPKYSKRGEIPAFEMIKNSITIHRGCFGGCSFCAIAAHQGKFIASRSEKSILNEVNHLTHRNYFKGHISDLGGPSANMYKMQGNNPEKCATCSRPSCLFPNICPNLNRNHKPITALYQKVRNIPNVKKVTIGSGIRYDMLLPTNHEEDQKNGLSQYLLEVINHHVSGRLKVAPEHTHAKVLAKMRKPPFETFQQFLQKFNSFNRQSGKNQQLIPYFISSAPACTIENMAELALLANQEHLITDQVQDFTPTPLTYSTAMYYLGYDPYTKEKIYCAKNISDKRNQNRFFFYHQKENRNEILQSIHKIHREDIAKKLFGNKLKKY